METLGMVLLLSAGPLLVTVITLTTAKKQNTAWRERRAARLAKVTAAVSE